MKNGKPLWEPVISIQVAVMEAYHVDTIHLYTEHHTW
jgi:hypothetical protein